MWLRLRGKNWIRRWAGGVMLCLLLSMLLPLAATLADSITVTVEVPTEVTASSQFVAKVTISGVQGFDVAQFDLSYDPDMLLVVGVAGGDIGGTTINIDAWGHVPPGQPGTIRVITNVPGTSGLDGSGHLAAVHFRLVGSACTASAIVLSDGLLGDKDGHPIPAAWVGRSLRLCNEPETEPVPTASSPTPDPVHVGTPPQDMASENRTPAGPAVERSATSDAALQRSVLASESQGAQVDPSAVPTAVPKDTSRQGAGAEEPAVPVPVTAAITTPQTLAATGQADDTVAASGSAPGLVPSAAPRPPEAGDASTSWIWVVAGLGGAAVIAGGTAIFRKAGGR